MGARADPIASRKLASAGGILARDIIADEGKIGRGRLGCVPFDRVRGQGGGGEGEREKSDIENIFARARASTGIAINSSKRDRGGREARADCVNSVRTFCTRG